MALVKKRRFDEEAENNENFQFPKKYFNFFHKNKYYFFIVMYLVGLTNMYDFISKFDSPCVTFSYSAKKSN